MATHHRKPGNPGCSWASCLMLRPTQGILNHQIMEYWKITVTILLPLLANIFSYWGLLRPGSPNTRKYSHLELTIRENIHSSQSQYKKIFTSRGNWEWLYCDSSRGIQWNIAWALGISLGLRQYFIVYPSSRHNTVTVNSFPCSISLWASKQCALAKSHVILIRKSTMVKRHLYR